MSVWLRERLLSQLDRILALLSVGSPLDSPLESDGRGEEGEQPSEALLRAAAEAAPIGP